MNAGGGSVNGGSAAGGVVGGAASNGTRVGYDTNTGAIRGNGDGTVLGEGGVRGNNEGVGSGQRHRRHRSSESPATAILYAGIPCHRYREGVIYTRGSGGAARLTRIRPATLCLLCGVQNFSFGQLWDRTELESGFVWPGHF